MKEIFEIYFETSQNDPDYMPTCIKYVATEDEVNNKIIPHLENDYGVNSFYGRLYDRKLSYCKLSYVKEWGTNNSLRIELK